MSTLYQLVHLNNASMLFRCFHDSRSIQVYELVNVCNSVLMLRDPEYALFNAAFAANYMWTP